MPWPCTKPRIYFPSSGGLSLFLSKWKWPFVHLPQNHSPKRNHSCSNPLQYCVWIFSKRCPIASVHWSYLFSNFLSKSSTVYVKALIDGFQHLIFHQFAYPFWNKNLIKTCFLFGFHLYWSLHLIFMWVMFLKPAKVSLFDKSSSVGLLS